MFINIFRIYETVARARVNKSGNRRHIKRRNGDGRHKGIGIGESGRVVGVGSLEGCE